MPRNLFTEIPGPILVMGASGFVGANLFRAILRERADVVGTFFSGNLWRLHDIPSKNMAYMNIQDPISIKTLLLRHRPKVVFDCSAFGAYSFEQDVMRIHSTNYLNFFRFMELATSLDLFAYVHAGSSSEYGLNASAPAEDATLIPNSHYAVSKAAISQAITYYGSRR